MTGCAILILAAGASSRMRGGDKLLEQVAGRPLLRLMLERAVEVAAGPVLCTLPGPDHPRLPCLDGLAVTPVFVPDASAGMGASIRAGVTELPNGCRAVMILPADLPELVSEDLRVMVNMWQEHPDAILRAMDQDDNHGHPVIFPADLFPALIQCHGDAGARDLLRANVERMILVPLPGYHATIDLDTPEDWAAWRGDQ